MSFRETRCAIERRRKNELEGPHILLDLNTLKGVTRIVQTLDIQIPIKQEKKECHTYLTSIGDSRTWTE